MSGGRPRTTSPNDEDLASLGEEMIEWVNENKPVHLSEWYSIHKHFIYKDWKAIIQHDAFLPYYEEALHLVGQNYLKKDTEVEPNLKQRWLRVYFRDLREQEDRDKDDDVIRQKSVAEAVPQEVRAQTDALVRQIEELRGLASESKQQEAKASTDAHNE